MKRPIRNIATQRILLVLVPARLVKPGVKEEWAVSAGPGL